MTAKNPKFNGLIDFHNAFPDERACRLHFERIRWNGQIACVHCGSMRKIYRINEGKLFRCADCDKQFTVRLKTIFEDSALPLRKWFMAIYIFMAHKKGISSVQLSKDIQVTQKTAWFMLHRIRYAVRTRKLDKPLNGIVEADETYVGGKMHGGKRGTGAEKKTIVFGIIERKGKVVARTIKHADKKTLQGIMREQVSRDAIVMTDDNPAYRDLEETFDSHESVNHSKKEYVRGDVHVNNIESFWALFKRGYHGTYHWMSPKHMDKYIDEFEFRLNSKDITDPSRLGLMLNHAEGRMTYKQLIRKNGRMNNQPIS